MCVKVASSRTRESEGLPRCNRLGAHAITATAEAEIRDLTAEVTLNQLKLNPHSTSNCNSHPSKRERLRVMVAKLKLEAKEQRDVAQALNQIPYYLPILTERAANHCKLGEFLAQALLNGQSRAPLTSYTLVRTND